MAEDTGVVQIRGKDYKTVALRIKEFRDNNPNWAIDTEILIEREEEIIIRAQILNSVGAVKATGIAHETKDEDVKKVNYTSWVENCETSAIGRALACFGMNPTEQFASADEMTEAVMKQEINKVIDRQARHIRAAFMYYDSVMAIKQGIATDDLSTAAEAWFTLGDETKEDLWLSPKRGAVWTTQERTTIQSKEFREAHFGIGAGE